MSNAYATDQQARINYGDPPGDDPVRRLRHVLRVFRADRDYDLREVITATSNVYIDEDWTGLTMGDLYALARALSLDEQAIERAARAAHESYERRVARLVPGVPETPWERLSEEEVEQSLEDMRAAFAALRNDDEQEER